MAATCYTCFPNKRLASFSCSTIGPEGTYRLRPADLPLRRRIWLSGVRCNGGESWVSRREGSGEGGWIGGWGAGSEPEHNNRGLF